MQQNNKFLHDRKAKVDIELIEARSKLSSLEGQQEVQKSIVARRKE